MVQTVKNTLRWTRRGPIPWNTVVQNNTNWAPIKAPLRVTQQQKIPSHPTKPTKNPHNRYWQKSSQRKLSWAKKTTSAVLQALCRDNTWRSLHDGQQLRLYDLRSKTWQPGTVQGQACAFRSYRVKLTTTRIVHHRTRSQLRPDKALSDHTNTQGSPVR